MGAEVEGKGRESGKEGRGRTDEDAVGGGVEDVARVLLDG